MIKEACVENFTDIPSVIERGANRIELCDNLVVSGTTPSIGVIKQSVRYCQERDVPVMVLIRPRSGDFVYSAIEKEIMLMDVTEAIQAGVKGIVIGALTEKSLVDQPFLKEVVNQAKEVGVKCTFPMAFDTIPRENQQEAVNQLEKIGYSRILTHGGPMEQDIFENVPHLKEIQSYTKNILMVPGGGVTKRNIEKLKEILPLKEAHGTKLV